MRTQPNLAIVGPTAVGKTATAIQVAKQRDYWLISADSQQVYRGMDIGTGKEVHLGQWQTIKNHQVLVIDGVPIFGLDLATPDQPFSAIDYRQYVQRLFKDFPDRANRCVFIGGTGFYLQALQGKINTSTPANPSLRQELSQLSVDQLWQRLHHHTSIKAQSLNHSDRHNPVRLIRLIELSQPQDRQADSSHPPSADLTNFQINLQQVALTLPRPQLYRQADQRVDYMIDQGLVAEVVQLIKQYDPNLPAFNAIGYRQIIECLQGHTSLTQAIQNIKSRNHHYIRRQYTWFNKQPLTWLPADDPNLVDKISHLEPTQRSR